MIARALIVLVLLAGSARADTHRIAIVAGNNTGAGEAPLHFADADASKLSRVLLELGGIEPADMHLLQGATLAQIHDAFDAAGRRISALHHDPANRVIVIFYFSGHSDGEALELGGERLAFAELRRWLASSGADVRVALVDSCKSGALLTAKGGTAGPEFQIRLTDDLSSTGEALLTSSAADEVALESREIGGSFFTHHLVSGLRGAADASGDGTVTLTEAYQYAYGHTIATTGATVIGPQHPAYDYRLTGQGELVLTDVSRPSARLEVPAGYERVLVVEPARGQVIAELTTDARRTVALQPGRYTVRAWRAGHAVAGDVTVAAGERRLVRSEELLAVTAVPTASKGGGLASEDRRAVLVAGGVSSGIADSLVSAGLRGDWFPSHHGYTVSLGIRSATGYEFRETSVAAHAGYSVSLHTPRGQVLLGAAAGPNYVRQNGTGSSSESHATLGLDVVGTLGMYATITRDFALGFEVEVGGTEIRHDSTTSAVPLAAMWLGLTIRVP